MSIARLSEVLVAREHSEWISVPENETFVTVRMKGAGAVRREIGEGKTPRQFRGSRIRAGDLIYSRIDARNGAFALVPDYLDGAVVSKDFPTFALAPERVDSVYLSHVIRTPAFWARFRGMSFGATNRQRVDERLLLTQKIPLPPLPEQRRVAAILDEADALRRTQERTTTAAAALAEAAFHSFEQHLDATVVPLSDIAHISSGITKGRKPPAGPLEPVDYLTVANVQDKRLDLSAVRQIEVSKSEIDRYRLAKGDLLLTEGGDPDKLGRGVVWNDELPLSIHQNHVFKVRLHDNGLSPTWLNWEISSPYGKKYFLRAAKQTTGIATINSSQLKAFPVRVPQPARVDGLLRELESIKTQDTLLARRSTAFDGLFASLQHRAFRGEL